jgi:high affinity sulfate transporter 1
MGHTDGDRTASTGPLADTEWGERPSVISRHVPGVGVLQTYQRSWVRSDLVAGVVLAAILVPQGMAYAELAGLPPVNGLYTTVACLVTYAVMGPSRILVLGPDSSLGPLIFAAIAPLVVAGDDPGTAIALAGMLAILVGLIQVGLAVGKLGFVADLLSSEVQIGYMNGLAVTIIAGQLPKLCGFSTDADGFVDDVREFVADFDQRDATALAVGLTTLGVLLILPRFTRRIPAVLVAVVGATAATAIFGFDIATVGTLPQGLPALELPWTTIGDVVPLVVAAVGITLVSLTDTIALSTSFNARRGEPVAPNQEMIGIGSANIAAGLFQGFAISSSSSRTAVAEQSGAKSQLTGLVGAGVVVLLLVFFNGLLAELPTSALAAVVIAAALTLADVSVLRKVRRVRPSAVVLSIIASAGVIFLGVLDGILVAVTLSVLLFFQRNWWPHGEVLGRVSGRDGWHSDSSGDGLVQRADVVVFRWEAPLFFANSGLFAQQVRELVRERRPAWVVLQCEAITDIDVTAADMLERLDHELNAHGVHVAFVELRTRLRQLVHDYGLNEELDRDHFYNSIDEALADIDGRAGSGPATATSGS